MDFPSLWVNLLGMLRFITFISSLLIAATSLAQERCGTVQYEKMLHQRNPKKESIEQFEKWMNNRLNQKKPPPLSTQRTQATSTIPVVIHVIHNGEPIGTGLNISDAQIQSQMKVLNDDFNRLNADRVNTPALFQPVAASFDVQFVLALQDPAGSPTTGIVRVKGSKSSWDINSDDYLLKSQSYWPPEQYLNIWVTNLSSFLGYAQLPLSTSLPGLENSPNERLTDGIVINYKEFGSIDGGSFNLTPRYNKGRTLTHEMGHFFGLRHIWGDVNSCTSTDYVNDTPTQDNQTAGCPSHPQTNCAAPKMFQNYLDYTDDRCMNIFTQGQVARMNTIIQNSPRRKELPSSMGSQPPTNGSFLDLALVRLESPSPVSCLSNPLPQIRIKNNGNVPITSFTVSTTLNGGSTRTQAFSTPPINPYSEQVFQLNPIVLNQGDNRLGISLSNPNGAADNPQNNNGSFNLAFSDAKDIIPLRERFDSNSQLNWTIAGQGQPWARTATNYSNSLFYNSFTNTNIGEESWLVSPVIDLSQNYMARLSFDYSYAKLTKGNELLRILASTDCGVTFDNPIIEEYGDELTTTLSSPPASPTDWKRKPLINLDNWLGQKAMRFAFVATNGNGNNIYLDNIEFFIDDDHPENNVASPYAVYGGLGSPLKITFNLEERQAVRIVAYNSTGQEISDQWLPETLNQTYPIDMGERGSGLYILRLQIGNQLSSNKVFVGN
jgi:Pregnancy-associated plasma protein-A